jgi:hypothetical protein
VKRKETKLGSIGDEKLKLKRHIFFQKYGKNTEGPLSIFASFLAFFLTYSIMKSAIGF